MLSLFKHLHQYITIIFFLIVAAGRAKAQQVIPIPFPLEKENFSVAGFAAYTLTPKNINDYNTLAAYSFKTLQNSNNLLQLPATVESAWISFSIKNNLSADTSLVVKTDAKAKRIFLYELTGGSLKEVGRAGNKMPSSQLSNEDGRRIKVFIKAGSIHNFFIRQQQNGVDNVLYIPELTSNNQAIIERSYDDNYNLPETIFSFFITGFNLAISIFGFVNYYNRHRDKAYLWYGIANLLACIFVLIDINIIVLDTPLWNNLNQMDYFLLFNAAMGLAYFQFQNQILQLGVNKPKLAKLINVYAVIIIAGVLFTLIADQLRIFTAVLNIVRNSSNLLGLIMIIVLLVYLRKRRTGFNKYIYYGLLCWVIGLCIYVPYIFFGLRRYLPSIIRGNLIMGVPVAIEMVFFLKALVYRDQQTEREKIHYQQQLIEQLERNKAMQLSFTKDLEKQVEDRTTELIEQRKTIEQAREEKLRADFERRFSESELKALRSQINPHFIFNVLNTIESFALENNTEAASDMIQKFSKLTRLVLENSMQQLVPFEQDLQALQLYVELEKMRYDEKFKVQYDIDKNLLDGNCFIPPMIIQPYVENAILHGLRNLSSEDGLLKISGHLNSECIAVTIKDNGIGRRAAALLKANNPIAKSSVGMKVTHDRITVFNSLVKGGKAKVEIEDMEKGTKVRLWFPLLYDL